MSTFFREKFDIILVTTALVIVGITWIQLDFEVKLEPYVFALFGSWLTVLGLRPRPNVTNTDTTNVTNTDHITADNIESATTEQGDIIGQPAPIIRKSKEE